MDTARPTAVPAPRQDPDLVNAYLALSPEKRALLAMALARPAGSSGLLIPVLDRTGQDFAPSYAQERLWFLDQLEPGSAAYVVPIGVRLRGDLDVDALTGALSAIVARHEALRTTFPAVDGRPVQRIAQPVPIAVPVTDLREKPVGERAEALLAACRAEAGRPFDLGAGPLIRARLLCTADDTYALLVGTHHIVSDGWSLGVLVQELSVLYGGGELPPLPIQYADFAAWQRAWLSTGVLDEQLAYWRDKLTGAPPLILPADRPRLTTGMPRGDAVPVRLGVGLAGAAAGLAAAERATPFMVLLAVFALVLTRWSDETDLVIGTPVAGRGRAQCEPLIGFFANTVPLRISTSGDPTFRQLLARVRDACLDAYAHQDAPYEKVVEALRLDRANAPLIQVMFAMRNTPAKPSLPGVELTVLDMPSQVTKFDLNLEIGPGSSGGDLVGRAEFAADVFTAATITSVTTALGVALAAASARPDLPIARVPLASPTTAATVPVASVPDSVRAALLGPAGFDPHERVEVLLLDRGDGAVPAGFPGEVCLAARSRIIRTGQRGRLRAGTLELLGDAPITRIGGLRVDAKEIAEVVGAHPAVTDAYVRVVDADSDRPWLTGYVTAVGPSPPGAGELRRFVRARLPEPLVPEIFTFLDRLPRDVAGAVVETDLPATARMPRTGYVAPADALERILAEMWAQVLEADRVGVCDHFFDLGGHSLLATQVVARIHRLFRLDLPLRDFLTVNTVRELAEVVREAGRAAAVDVDRIASATGDDPAAASGPSSIKRIDRRQYVGGDRR